MAGEDMSADEWQDGVLELGESESLFFSDELREVVEDILADEASNSTASLGDFRFIMTSEGVNLVFDLVKMEQSPGELVISGTGNRAAARQILARDPSVWVSVDVLQGDVTLRSFSLSNRSMSSSVEFPSGSSSCLLTVICTDPPAHKTKAKTEIRL